MLMHKRLEAGGGKTILQLLDEVRAEVAVLIPPEYNRFPHSFSHIFAGGYGAGYYQLQVAGGIVRRCVQPVRGAPACSIPDVGARFPVAEIPGSSAPVHAVRCNIVSPAFRGREPSIDALLRHNGLTDAI